MNDIYNLSSGKTNIFWTSDTHFGHTNIIKYCQRPFENVDEMNQKMIENWNNVVGPDDVVFHLGDVGFGSVRSIVDILQQLNGHKYLILGNHDWSTIKGDKAGAFRNCFEDCTQQMKVRVDGRVIWMNHFPFLTFENMYNGMDAAWQLFGHVHSGKHQTTGLDINRLQYLYPNQYDVGVDNNNYTPVSYDQVKSIITEQMLSQNLYRQYN